MSAALIPTTNVKLWSSLPQNPLRNVAVQANNREFAIVCKAFREAQNAELVKLKNYSSRFKNYTLKEIIREFNRIVTEIENVERGQNGEFREMFMCLDNYKKLERWLANSNLLEVGRSIIEIRDTFQWMKRGGATRDALITLTKIYLENSEQTALDLSFLSLTQIPNEVLNMRQLTWLRLRGNHIKVIPPEIDRLTELRTLFLNRNSIKQVPIQLLNMTNLKILDLSDNQLDHFPEAIRQHPTLEEVYLNDNEIDEEPTYTAEQMPRLVYMNLCNNRLYSCCGGYRPSNIRKEYIRSKESAQRRGTVVRIDSDKFPRCGLFDVVVVAAICAAIYIDKMMKS